MQEVKTCGICKQTKTIDNFNSIIHTPSKLQKNCCHCNARKSSDKKRGRQQERVSKFWNRLTPLSQFLGTLTLPDVSKVIHDDCPPEIQATVLLPLQDFAPIPEMPTEYLDTCSQESYFCLYAKYLAGTISEKTSYRWW
jgi:hypothetical protein